MDKQTAINIAKSYDIRKRAYERYEFYKLLQYFLAASEKDPYTKSLVRVPRALRKHISKLDLPFKIGYEDFGYYLLSWGKKK